MSAQLICQTCGFENDFNRLHCSKCGSRLNFQKIEKQHHAVFKASRRGHGFRLMVRLVLFCGLLAALLLMLWPEKPQGSVGTAADADQYAARMFQLEEGIKRRQSTVQIFQEREVNAYLAKLIEHNQAAANEQKRRMSLTGINLKVRDADLVAVVTVRQGSVYFTYSLYLTPSVVDGKVVFQVDRFAWGHLPIPVYARDWLVRRIVEMFAGLKSERTVLDHAVGFDVKESMLRVTLPAG